MTSTMTGTSSALQLTNGRITTGGNKLILPDATSVVTRTTGFVNGNLRKKYSANGNKTFEVGTNNGYSPVSVNATAGTFPLDFTARATQGLLLALPNPAAELNRYWTLTATGLTANVTFNYLDPTDIPAGVNENNFVIYKFDNGTLTTPGGLVNTAANTATIVGVSTFSEWTLAVPAPVVSTINDVGAGSLRQAVTDATPGDTITFNLGAGPHSIALSSEVAIDKDLTITGPTSNPLTISGGGATRVFNVGASRFVTLSNLTIANGSTTGDGGGIANNGNLTIFNSTFSNNNATGHGGAIRNNGTLKITNSTLSDNHATSGVSDGGAISSGIARMATLGSVTLVKNSAGHNGGGIHSSGTLNFKNSILALNTAVTFGNNLFIDAGTANSSGYNVCSDDGASIFGAPGDQINTDPILGPLKNNGGPTFTHAPLSNSPAIDKGQDLGADGNPTARDQRGSLRPVTYDAAISPPAGGDHSDIGAVELPPGVIPVSASSVKSHGGTPFPISLPLTGPVGIECRSGGATNDYQVVVTFASPVAFSSAAVTSGAGSVPTTMNSGNQVTLNLTGVTNAQTLTLALFDVNDGVKSGDVGIRMGMLIGDASGNGTVNSTDVSQTKLRSGQAASAANFRSDFNASGAINATDVSTVKIRSGTSLP